ncbi:uncharacterized protein LOC127852433 [Dreissena polymorpha]|uniref:uncharacterized protein LOC127852433 n=1 Tax=Dreissena polymorpha TaxID=45954 RepID=UPI0022646FAC|nr:uncharacterized protein LOC127852433 [Dreissena polymorpha]
MDKLKSLFEISSFEKKKDVQISKSADSNLAGCPEEYAELPVCALEMKTQLKLAEYLDKKGKLLKVEIDNIPLDVLNDITGLAKLSGQEDCLDNDTVESENQVKSPTMMWLDRWNYHGFTIGRLWEYLLTLQRYDVIHDCRRNIMSDCKTFLNKTKNSTMTWKKFRMDDGVCDPSGLPFDICK